MNFSGADLAVGFIKAGVFVYDVITYPVYAIIQRPWRRRKAGNKQRVRIEYVT